MYFFVKKIVTGKWVLLFVEKNCIFRFGFLSKMKIGVKRLIFFFSTKIEMWVYCCFAVVYIVIFILMLLFFH